MTTHLSHVTQLIMDLGCDPIDADEHAADNTVCYLVSTLSTSLKVYAILENKGALLQIYAYPYSQNLDDISPDARLLLLEMVNTFNNALRYGRWSIDDDGDARVHFSLFLENSPLTHRQLARIHFLLSDLMVHQGQLLQMQARIPYPLEHRFHGVSAAVLKAAMDHPEAIEDILKATHASKDMARCLYEAIGLTLSDEMEKSSDTTEEVATASSLH